MARIKSQGTKTQRPSTPAKLRQCCNQLRSAAHGRLTQQHIGKKFIVVETWYCSERVPTSHREPHGERQNDSDCRRCAHPAAPDSLIFTSSSPRTANTPMNFSSTQRTSRNNTSEKLYHSCTQQRQPQCHWTARHLDSAAHGPQSSAEIQSGQLPETRLQQSLWQSFHQASEI